MTQPGLVEARIEIQDRLLSYTRGIDRLDADLVRSAFHPDAQLVDYGPNPMSIEEFAAYAISSLRERFVATQHRVSNIRVEVEGNNAVLEAYVLAYHVQETGGDRILHTFNGRYIDECSLREGAWKIHKRTLRKDWTKVEKIDEEMNGTWPSSARDHTGPIYITS